MQNSGMAWVLPLALLAAGCASIRSLSQPQGDGGWTPEQRQQQLSESASVAGVAYGPTAAVSAGAAMPAERPPLDLSETIAMAARANRRIAAAQTDVAIAAERVADARGRLLPSTIGSGRYTWYTDPLTNQVQIPSSALPSGVTIPRITIRDANVGTINGTLTLPIDLSGELRHTLRAAQAGYRGEQARLWATTLEQQVAAVRAYFQLLEAQRLREVTEQTLAVDRAQVENASAKFDNGRVTKNDLLVTQVALRNAEQELVRRDLAIDQARWQLNQIVGAEVNAPTRIADVRWRPDLPPVDDLLRDGYQHNPLLLALLEERQRIEESTTALERSRLPRFNAGGAIDYSTSDVVQPQRVGSGFTGFTWDLGTDLRREAQIAEARLTLDRNRIALEAQMRELENAVRSLHRAVAERLSALAAAEAAVGQAEENLRIRQQQFDAGRAQSDDVLLAEALLSQQRATLASALYQAHAGRAELQQLLGLSLDNIVAVQR